MASDEPLLREAEFRDAFLANERQVRINTGKLACALVFVLMPLGVTADLCVYRDYHGHNYVLEFLALRLMCSLLIVGVWLLHDTPVARKFYPLVGMPIVILPALSMCLMMYRTEGAASPYYAALNLILLAVSAVGHWSIAESLFATFAVMCLYFATYLASPAGTVKAGVFYTDNYFIVLTGTIVVCGNYLFNRLRFREFALRCELDRQNLVLESTIEQLKETEIQLVQTEKLASLGRMSAGIIHEINNPLNFATTALFTLRKKGKYLAAEQQEEYQDVLKDVEEGIKRVKNIVSDLRKFSHPDTEGLDQVELAEVAESALRFLSNECKDKVRLEQKLPEHQTVWANKNKLIQVVMNLVQNSLYALKSKTFVNEQPTIWIEGRLESGKSILVVRDNGTGIDPENLNKIFDPFFTTKDVGEGMGLGLSICYRIVQECEGRISARSERGKFCEFTLEFPAKG